MYLVNKNYHSALAFQNRSEYYNVDFRLIDNHFCTSCRNLVRFGLVIRSLRCKNLYSQRRIFYTHVYTDTKAEPLYTTVSHGHSPVYDDTGVILAPDVVL